MVEIVQSVNGLVGVVAVIANELTDPGPVLLLKVGVVVFLVRAAAGELNLFGFTPAKEMVIDKLPRRCRNPALKTRTGAFGAWSAER